MATHSKPQKATKPKKVKNNTYRSKLKRSDVAKLGGTILREQVKKNKENKIKEKVKKPVINRKVKVKIKDQIVSLTPEQKTFCEIYCSKGEFFANGVQSYIEAYDIDPNEPGAYTGAKSSAYKLLTNTDILQYINSLLELGNLNDAFVDKQLEFVITQNAELGAKVAGIREYNKLKSRITEKLKIEGDLNIVINDEPSGDYAEFIKNKVKNKVEEE